MKDYLDITYNKEVRPYTDYPHKLVAHLCDLFELRPGMKLLEPGCGRGEHLRIFRDLGLDVFGSDLSPEAPQMAKDLNVSVCNLDKEPLPYENSTFDVIYSKSFLEHLWDPSIFLLEAYRVLKPGGVLISMVPDWESQHKKFYDDYTHVKPFTIVSLANIKTATGFTEVRVEKFRQLPSTWNSPILTKICDFVSIFVPVRVKNPTLRWCRELMLLGSSRKPSDD